MRPSALIVSEGMLMASLIRCALSDFDDCRLLLIFGTSLQVR